MNPLSIFISFASLIAAMSVHEFSHAWVANKLGDTTAKYSGRLTLNPLAHIDFFWTILLPLFLFISTGGRFIFGAAKPVPINFSALKNPKRDIIWVGLSGPLSNFIFAFISGLVLRFLPLPLILAYIFQSLILINIILGVFNLIPIPPLDGSRVLIGLMPQSWSYAYSRVEPYGFLIVLLLIWLGLFEVIIWPAVVSIYNVLLFNF